MMKQTGNEQSPEAAGGKAAGEIGAFAPAARDASARASLMYSLQVMQDQLTTIVNEIGHSALHYQMLYESTPAMLYSIDASGRLLYTSDLWLAKTGYGREEVIGRALTDFLDPTSCDHVTNQTIPELFRVGRIMGIERQLVCKDGTLIDTVVSAITTHDAQGRRMSMSVMQDVTERNQAQTALVAEHARLQVTLDSIGDGVIAVDRGGNVEYLNPVAEKLTGWPNPCARGLPLESVFCLVDEATRRRLPTPLVACCAADEAAERKDPAILLGRHGRDYCVDISVSPIKNAAGDATGVVLVFRDVSESVHLHREMRYRATHDALTGILNRDEFERRLGAVVDAAHCSGLSYALMYIDLDRFKLVNDAGGHAAGDRLLKRTVGLIGRLIRQDDSFARLGGDEFALLIRDCRLDDAKRLAQRICREVDAFRFREGKLYLHIGASIGLVMLDRQWTTATSALQAADSACYAAKAAGRNRVHTYIETDESIESHREDMQWVRRLEAALDKGQFALHWQQITSLGDAADGVHGEVLLRLVGEDGKLIPAGLFLPSAERFQMASRIDRWVVREVFELLTKYEEGSAHVATVSINLSGQSIGDVEFHSYVLGLMDSMQFNKQKICFEITETAVITNLTDASAFFESMRARGVRFALDDFGSGVCSFGYLKALPVDYLKIDGQFIEGLVDDPVNQVAVRCVREVARITGKKTVAEFVETETVELMLREIGIDYSQGFLRHRPAPISQMFETLGHLHLDAE